MRQTLQCILANGYTPHSWCTTLPCLGDDDQYWIVTLRLRWWCCFNNQHKIMQLMFWYLYFVLVLVFDVLAFISLSVNSWWSDKSEMSPEWLHQYRRKNFATKMKYERNLIKNQLKKPLTRLKIGKQIRMKKEKKILRIAHFWADKANARQTWPSFNIEVKRKWLLWSDSGEGGSEADGEVIVILPGSSSSS